MNEDPERLGPGAPGLVRGLLHSAFAADVAVFFVVGGAVQLAFPSRFDWPAHLVAGAGMMLVLASLAPARLGRWTAAFAYVVVAFMGWISEHLFFGPPDWADVAFTLAGAVLALDLAGEVGAAPSGLRREARIWGLALVGLALVWRYRLTMALP